MKALTSQQIEAFRQAIPSAKLDEPMSKHTSFRMGGPARLYVIATTSDLCVGAVEQAKRLEIPWYVFGGGSNLLVADAGFEGLMIQMQDQHFVIGEDGLIECGAGAISALIARKVTEAGFGGFEWATGLPGTVGGATYGNGGCYGGEMKDTIVEVDALRLSDDERVTYQNRDCQFAYRESRFKREPHLILTVRMKLERSPDPVASKTKLDQIMQKRKEEQPLGQSTAGSTFKNFEFQDETELSILKRAIDEIPPEFLKRKVISAGWLIDQAGLRGQAVGDISVSMKHGNFFINKGKGRAQDVLALISLVKMKVRDEYGIALHEEVQLVGFE